MSVSKLEFWGEREQQGRPLREHEVERAVLEGTYRPFWGASAAPDPHRF